MEIIITTMEIATALIPMPTTLWDNPPPLWVEKRIAVKVSNRTVALAYGGKIKGKVLKGLLALILLSVFNPLFSQDLVPGAERFEAYSDLLEGKRVGLIANHSSMVQGTHLVDFLLAQEVNLVRIFAPEHGFRGEAAAGAKIKDGKDERTGLEVVSLYGTNRRPLPSQLEGIDIMLFDLQDVGTRFYTYISTMSLAMDACAEFSIPFVVLDRPNPNGHYVDGPVLDPTYTSFVGMHPVPVVHGMTVGEYASMVNNEGWLVQGEVDLTVVRCEGYTHGMLIELPIRPSPNLPNASAVALYPSLCFFEGTSVSIGRGTDFPFQVMGAPWMSDLGFQFTPESRTEAPQPKFRNEVCYGVDLRSFGEYFMPRYSGIYWYWLIQAYEMSPNKEGFFSTFFDRLAGTDKIRLAIEGGADANSIKALYKDDLDAFKLKRQKYLLYR